MDGGGVGCSEARASAANSSGGAAANAIIEVVKLRRVIRFTMQDGLDDSSTCHLPSIIPSGVSSAESRIPVSLGCRLSYAGPR